MTVPLLTIDSTGVTAPSYGQVLAGLQASAQSIFGSDIVIDNDSQDGQLLGLFALAISNCYQIAESVYNSFSPATAQGDGLSNVVQINGLTRNVATFSTVTLTINGTPSTVITNGQVRDTLGQLWNLPPTVTIGGGGSVSVTGTAAAAGAVTAAPGTITQIATPTRGWTAVTNAASASVGNAIETDAQLRIRQASSVALPAQSILDGMVAAVQNLSGVIRAKGYVNPTASTDANGMAAYSTDIVVQGGTVAAIAGAIALKKSPGPPTFGGTTQVVVDPKGISNTIKFDVLVQDRIIVQVDASNLGPYVNTTDAIIKQAIADYINSLDIGVDVYMNKVISVAQLPTNPLGLSFNVTAVRLSISPASPTAANVVIAFNHAASCAVSDITLTVT